jgi:hypothetical protein
MLKYLEKLFFHYFGNHRIETCKSFLTVSLFQIFFSINIERVI